MEIETGRLPKDEQVPLLLRGLFEQRGYRRYRMSNFEAYDLYRENKNFLESEGIITFTDASGRLMALKPDVTMSIVKHTKPDAVSSKLYYVENVFRLAPQSGEYREISQMGLEFIGGQGGYAEAEAVELAVRSLAAIGPQSVLDVGHMGFITSLLDVLGVREEARAAALDALRGLNLLSMIAYHTCWDLVYLFRMDWEWYRGTGAYIWQQSICWTFILLSGFCFSLGRRPLRRGLTVFGCGWVVTLVTVLFMPEEQIWFGVLTLIGSCMLLMVPLEKLLRHVPVGVGLAASAALFTLLRNVNQGTLGFEDWRASTALVTGITAKESVVSTLSVLTQTNSDAGLSAALQTIFTPVSAFAYLCFTVLYMPCIAAFAATRRELGSIRQALGAVGYQTLVAYLVAFLVFQIGSMFF